MAKRGRIQLNGANPIIRIVPPGFDVDTAPDQNFQLHENHLYSQPFHWTFAPCPFAGYGGGDARDEWVDISYPNVGNEPIVILYPVGADWVATYPAPRGRADGNNTTGFPGLPSWYVFYDILSTSTLRVRFLKSTSARESPNGAYVLMWRVPNA